MNFEHIRLEISPSAVATVTLARPERLNAMSAQTVDEVRALEAGTTDDFKTAVMAFLAKHQPRFAGK